ncbi:D-alanyl-D-alanine carboxypeptidase [Gemmiger formicilis]|uniref:D-alanyl-D-alanine carboxypeptidase family protein n=1 Tax=Gemmiger formicilis TaxID=745368 RepID=UPI00210D7FAD|nr:D-alanyl-D-alanine carboxypeptidase family protein [Gemmiger formicilis]MCQ5078627.1 D-alanyl-D-alanine carboxypeptidase [Gemmiger formicilis]MCQ5114938.1 D-alanyl-D-alanine carboxypeptidase [Gemmiger formicilis]
MNKRAVTLLLCLMLAALSILRGFTASAAEFTPATTADFDVPCAAAILVDEDSGTVLYEKNADARRPIASITKVMTLLLTFEALEAGKISLDDFVPVSEHAYHMGGSQIWLEPGEEMTLNDMLKAICISSANDAAVAVAEYVGGSEPAFAEMMNARAAELGMTNTHFVNACGLDEPEHLSTARDVAAMSREMLLHHTEVRDYCSIWMDTLRGGATQLVNTNKLLKSYSGITGLKTGTTGKAGVCISASAERDGLRLIAVVLGAASGKERFQAASTLLDYGFSHFESAAAELPADAPLSLPVERGTAESVVLTYTAPERCLMPKGESSTLQVALDLPQKLAAPIRAGETVGTVKISNGSAELASYPVTAAQDVDALSFTYCLHRLAEGLLLTS